jgi:hypothetical protein
MEWLMVGTSPSVEDTLPKFDDFAGRIITTNGGIRLCRPDVFVGVDGQATRIYIDEIRAAAAAGTRLVTLHRDSEAALKTRGVEWYDEFLRCSKTEGPRVGGYGRFRFSGPLCLEYACNNGAETIHLVGFDGYRWQGDYTSKIGRLSVIQEGSKRHGVQKTANVLKPACDEIANAWSGVQFVQYGKPTFSVAAKNWSVVA